MQPNQLHGWIACAGTLDLWDLGQIGDHLAQLITRQLYDAERRQTKPPPEPGRIKVYEPREEQRDDRAARHHDHVAGWVTGEDNV